MSANNQLKEKMEDPLFKSWQRLSELIVGALLLFLFLLLFWGLGWKYIWQPQLKLQTQLATATANNLSPAEVVVVFPPCLSIEDKGELIVNIKNISNTPITTTVTLSYNVRSLIFNADEALLAPLVLTPGESRAYQLAFQTTAPPTIPLQVNVLVIPFNGDSLTMTAEVSIKPFVVFQKDYPKDFPGFRNILLSMGTKILSSIASVFSSIGLALFQVIFTKTIMNSIEKKPGASHTNIIVPKFSF